MVVIIVVVIIIIVIVVLMIINRFVILVIIIINPRTSHGCSRRLGECTLACPTRLAPWAWTNSWRSSGWLGSTCACRQLYGSSLGPCRSHCLHALLQDLAGVLVLGGAWSSCAIASYRAFAWPRIIIHQQYACTGNLAVNALINQRVDYSLIV